MIYDASVRPNKAVGPSKRFYDPCLTIIAKRSCLTIIVERSCLTNLVYTRKISI